MPPHSNLSTHFSFLTPPPLSGGSWGGWLWPRVAEDPPTPPPEASPTPQLSETTPPMWIRITLPRPSNKQLNWSACWGAFAKGLRLCKDGVYRYYLCVNCTHTYVRACAFPDERTRQVPCPSPPSSDSSACTFCTNPPHMSVGASRKKTEQRGKAVENWTRKKPLRILVRKECMTHKKHKML